MRLLVALSLFLSPIARAGCDDVAAKLASLDGRLQYAIGKLKDVYPSLVRGEMPPKWDDFDRLDTAIGTLREVRSGADFARLEPELKALAPWIREQFVAEHPPLGAPYVRPEAKVYKATDYELSRAYQRKLAELNSLLPAELRYPIVRLPKDPRLTELPAKGREIVRGLETKVEALYATTGFASEEEYLKAYESASPEAKAVLKAFRDDTVRVAIRRPSRGRFWIEKVGFHNQFVTKSSNGLNDNDKRNQCEANYLDMKKADYAGLDPELKPQYVYFKPPEGSGWKENMYAGYGDDIYILRKDRIRDRLTFTPGDSLNRYVYSGGYSDRTVESWDQLMVPWKHRALMAPFFVAQIQQGKSFGVGYTNPRLPGELAKFKNKLGVSSDYPEGQIFGGLKMDDVAELHFTTKPPEGDFLKSLLERGIKIYDATANVNSPVPWEPPK